MKKSLLLCILLSAAFSRHVNAQAIRSVPPDSILQIIDKLPDSGTVVINFWATWCKPCVQELPYFKKADSLLKGENITFIFVSFDMPSKAKSVQQYIKKMNLSGTHYLISSPDLDRFINQVEKSWQGMIPYTIVLTKDDRKNHEGSFETFKELWNFIRE
jgi:thiol-disulfide isomerase/thioredoxin